MKRAFQAKREIECPDGVTFYCAAFDGLRRGDFVRGEDPHSMAICWFRAVRRMGELEPYRGQWKLTKVRDAEVAAATTPTNPFAENAGYVTHMPCRLGGDIVLYDRNKGFECDADERWIVMHEPSSLHVAIRTRAHALETMQGVALAESHDEAAQHADILPNDWVEPTEIDLGTDHAFTFCQYGGNGVDIKLDDTRTTERVFWSASNDTSPGRNSYVLVPSEYGEWIVQDVRCNIVSINGIGEQRWNVSSNSLRDTGGKSSDEQAVKHFGAIDPRGLVPYRQGQGRIVRWAKDKADALERIKRLAGPHAGEPRFAAAPIEKRGDTCVYFDALTMNSPFYSWVIDGSF